jgi:hypothetical protein
MRSSMVPVTCCLRAEALALMRRTGVDARDAVGYWGVIARPPSATMTWPVT